MRSHNLGLDWCSPHALQWVSFITSYASSLPSTSTRGQERNVNIESHCSRENATLFFVFLSYALYHLATSCALGHESTAKPIFFFSLVIETTLICYTDPPFGNKTTHLLRNGTIISSSTLSAKAVARSVSVSTILLVLLRICYNLTISSLSKISRACLDMGPNLLSWPCILREVN